MTFSKKKYWERDEVVVLNFTQTPDLSEISMSLIFQRDQWINFIFSHDLYGRIIKLRCNVGA